MDVMVGNTPGSYLVNWDTCSGCCNFTGPNQPNIPATFTGAVVTIAGCNQVSGHVSYDNTPQTPLRDSTQVMLNPVNPPGSPLTTQVDTMGYYQFAGLLPGHCQI